MVQLNRTARGHFVTLIKFVIYIYIYIYIYISLKAMKHRLENQFAKCVGVEFGQSKTKGSNSSTITE